MKRHLYGFAAVAIALGILYSVYEPAAATSGLPTDAEAKQILDSTHRHREWVSLPVGSSGLRVFTVYPERADRAHECHTEHDVPSGAKNKQDDGESSGASEQKRKRKSSLPNLPIRRCGD